MLQRRRPSRGTGGCIFAEQASRPFRHATVIWTRAIDPAVLAVVAHNDADPIFDLTRQPHAVAIDEDGHEHVAVHLVHGSLRLDVIGGSVLAGPVALDVHITIVPETRLTLRALDILLHLTGFRAVPASHRADRRLPRLVEALRVSDALAVGASQAEIAAGLVGALRDDWPGDGDYLRSRTRRRIALARNLLAAGPAAVLRHRV